LLIISNGGFKSGSTWLFNIASQLTSAKPVAKEFCNPEWVNPSLHHRRLSHTLASIDFHSRNFICKNHFGNQHHRNLLLRDQDIKVLQITRDYRDVVVAMYHHFKNQQGYDIGFERFYWRTGRMRLQRVAAYNQIWEPPATNLFQTRYELLHSAFDSEVQRLGEFLNVTTENKVLSRLRASTSIESLRRKYGDRKSFFRKGGCDGWRDYFGDEISRDIASIVTNGMNPVVYRALVVAEGVRLLPIKLAKFAHTIGFKRVANE